MIIHAVRFRQGKNQKPRGFRFRPGHGKFQAIACVGGKDVAFVASAIRFALSGRSIAGAEVNDATLHLSDDSGDTWLIDRNQTSVVCLKNGVPISAENPLLYLQAALLDRDISTDDARSLHVGCYRILAQGTSLQSVALGNAPYVDPGIRTTILKQINQISDESRNIFADSILARPKVMTTLVRFLEPLHGQIVECEKELQCLSSESQVSPEQIEKLKTEIAHLEKIAAISGPVLHPEKRSQGLRDELARTDAALAELLAQAGLSAPPTAKRVTDWRKPIEALARLETYAKLIRANQGARTYLEQNITPVYREYLKTIEDALVRDQQVTSELESCLACLTLQSASSTGHAPAESEASLPRATWFDRFKGRQEAFEGATSSPEPVLDVDSAKLAVEFALSRLAEVQERIGVTKTEFSAMQDKVGESQEDLIAIYGRLKEAWVKIAEEFKLPRDLSLKQLLAIVVSHTRMVALVDRRESLQSEIHMQSSKHAQLEHLLLEWRALTGSQKQTDLSHPNIVLAEARDVLRFFPNKKQRLHKLEESRVAAAVASRLGTRLKVKHRNLTKEWQKCLAGVVAEGEPAPQIAPHHEGWSDWFDKAHMLRSLALIYQTHIPEVLPPLLSTVGANTPLMLYMMADALPSDEMRQTLAHAVQDAAGEAFHLFVLADEKLLDILTDLGIGRAREIEDPSDTDLQEAALDAKPSPPGINLSPASPRLQTPTLSKKPPTPSPQLAAKRQKIPLEQRDPILSTKAREALAILTTKR